MSILVMAKVWASDVQPTNARFTLLALADNANDAGYCRPGVAYLSGKTGMSRSTVFRSLKALEEEALIERRARTRDNGSRTSNAYRINLELLTTRGRKVSEDEQSELASYFTDDKTPVRRPCQNDTGDSTRASREEKQQVIPPCQPDTPPSQSDTGSVSDWDGGSPNLTPLEPSFEPSFELNNPPQPPASRGELHREPNLDQPGERVRCAQHNRMGCRQCGLSARVHARAERDRSAAELAERERIGRECGMCIADGPAADGGTRWIRALPGTQVPVTPYDVCDHLTPHAVRIRELASFDMARVADDSAPEPTEHSSAAHRRRLLEARRKRSLPGVSAVADSSQPTTTYRISDTREPTQTHRDQNRSDGADSARKRMGA